METPEELWEKLVKTREGPTQSDLIYIIRNIASLRDRSWEMLVKQKIKLSTLCELAEEIPSLMDQIWQKIIQDNECQATICSFAMKKPLLRQKALEEFKEKGLTDKTLTYIIDNVDDLSEWAWTLLIKQCQDPKIYYELVRYNEKFREKVWAHLITLNPTNQQLTDLICFHNEIRKTAWQYFVNRSPDEESLAKIAEYGGEVAGLAWAKLKEWEPSKKTLSYFVEYNKRWSAEAWIELKKLDLTHEDLMSIESSKNSVAAPEALAMILAKDLDSDQLTDLITDVDLTEEQQQDAWQKLTAVGPSFENLYDILTSFKSDDLHKKCFKKILRSDPSIEEMMKIASMSGIFAKGSKVKELAADYLFKHWPQKEVYIFLATNSEKLALRAWYKLLKLGLTTKEMVEIMTRCVSIESDIWKELQKRELSKEDLQELEDCCCWMQDEFEEYRLQNDRDSIMNQIRRLKD